MTKRVEIHGELITLMHELDDTARAPFEKIRKQVDPLGLKPRGSVTLGSGDSLKLLGSHENALPEERILARIDAGLAKLDAARNQLAEIEKPITENARDKRGEVVRWLELALAGSVGYWTAISLLVGWAMQRKSAA